jgi:LacI family transcriptional regulator
LNAEPLSLEARRNVTLKDVAARARVSRATVSLVLRGSPLVASATRQRVEEAIALVGYVYNRGAARLRTGNSGAIGLIIPGITNPFYAELTAGADDVLDVEGRLTFLATSNDRPEREERLIRRIREQGVDGIILCAAEGSSPSLLQQLRAWRVPVVQILRAIAGIDGDFVAPDYRVGTQMALDHLVARGHRRISLMPSAKDTSATRERIESFRATMQRHGLGPGVITRGSMSREDAAAEMGRVLDKRSPPTAVICHNDLMALGAIGELRRRGLTPGHDIGVIGFDDIPEASNAVPALSTVATFPKDIGVQAARLLLRRIAIPDGPAERIMIAPALVVRAT